MKLSRLFILSGLLIAVVPTLSFAECVPGCAAGVSCRITAQGPPTVYQCDPAVRGVRSPSGALTAKQGSGNVAGKGSTPDSSNARSTGPTVGPRPPVAHKESIEIASVKSRRERAAKATDTPKQQP